MTEFLPLYLHFSLLLSASKKNNAARHRRAAPLERYHNRRESMRMLLLSASFYQIFEVLVSVLRATFPYSEKQFNKLRADGAKPCVSKCPSEGYGSASGDALGCKYGHKRRDKGISTIVQTAPGVVSLGDNGCVHSRLSRTEGRLFLQKYQRE